MANKNKAKGTRAESSIVYYLNKIPGIFAERKALKGNKDQGDIRVLYGDFEGLIEVKAGQQTANPSRTQLQEWQRQTIVEAKNAEVDDGIIALVVVRYRRLLKDADTYVLYRGDDLPEGYWIHCYLDEMVDDMLCSMRS